MNKLAINYSLYLVTDRHVIKDKHFISSIEEAIQGGVTCLQLREKDYATKDFYHSALELKDLTQRYHIPLLINDRIDIALAINADGVHIGTDDMPIAIARQLLGQNKIIGASVNCVEEALKAEKEGADYLGVGAMFPTTTKTNTENVSLDELKRIKAAVQIPIVAIGGINENNAPSILETGVNGIAVVSCILGKEKPKEAARHLISLF